MCRERTNPKDQFLNSQPSKALETATKEPEPGNTSELLEMPSRYLNKTIPFS